MDARALGTLVACLALGAPGCAARRAPTPRATPTRPGPSALERGIGALVDAVLGADSAAYDDPELARYVTDVGQRVARCSERRDVSWVFRVTDHHEPGACALPGGMIHVTRGLLPFLGSEAELAGVLAHEIAHGDLRHTHDAWDPGTTPLAASADALERHAARERDEERQADSVAARTLGCAGYDPGAMLAALRALERAESAALAARERVGQGQADDGDDDDDHAKWPARFARVALAAGRGAGQWHRARYLRALDGVAFGASARSPTVRGDRFVVPGVASFGAPEGYRATLEGGVATLASARGAPEIVATRLQGPFWVTAIRHGAVQDEHTVREVAGHRCRVFVSGRGDERALMAAIDVARDAELVLAVRGADARSRAALDAVLTSARRELAAPTPSAVLRVAAARPAETVAQFSARVCGSSDGRLAATLNGMAPAARLPAGALAKCVGSPRDHQRAP